jgi:hypothetical protein
MKSHVTTAKRILGFQWWKRALSSGRVVANVLTEAGNGRTLSDRSRGRDVFTSGANARLNPLYKVRKDGGHVHSDIFKNINNIYTYIY